MGREHFASTEAAVTAMLAVLHEHGRDAHVRHDIGTDQSARRTAAGAFTVTDEDGSLPHEALIEVGGSPAVEIEVYSEGTRRSRWRGDLPRRTAGQRARLPRRRLRWARACPGPPLPAGWWLVVPLPGDETYKEPIAALTLTPWLSGRVQ
ncbi:hypothetical protein NKH77_26340 [Streptomyces sp. M19]